ncbi:hypothetical protein ACFX1X_023991 [Malus domestica]
MGFKELGVSKFYRVIMISSILEVDFCTQFSLNVVHLRAPPASQFGESLNSCGEYNYIYSPLHFIKSRGRGRKRMGTSAPSTNVAEVSSPRLSNQYERSCRDLRREV